MDGTEGSSIGKTSKDNRDSDLSDICRPKVLKLQKKDHTLCAVCVEIGQTHHTMTYCFDCGRTMCKMCNLNHQQISAFRDHVRITLVSEGGEELVEEKLQSLVCVDHDNMIQKYCWDCSSPVCSVCLIFEHKDHTIKAFAYKPRDREENYEELRVMIETKMNDLQEKMEKIHCLKARQPHDQHPGQERSHVQPENAPDPQDTTQLDTELCNHDDRQENLAQVQEKVERAKQMVDMLLNRAGAVHRKQAELERLRALKEQVRQLDQSLPGPSEVARQTLPQGLVRDKEALVDTLMQQAEVVKQKQDELAKLKGLREQLRQIELSSLSKALECDDETPPAQVTLPELNPQPVDVIDVPNLTDRDLIMAIIRNISDQIPKLKEDSGKEDTTFVPCNLTFNLGDTGESETSPKHDKCQASSSSAKKTKLNTQK